MPTDHKSKMNKRPDKAEVLKFSNGRTSKVYHLHSSVEGMNQEDLEDLMDIIVNAMKPKVNQ